MSPFVCSCVICGSAIAEWPGTVSWRNQFRGLYSGPEGLVVTGLGVYADPDQGAFIASPDTNASWDSYEPSDDDAFGANQQSPRNNRHGFLFHGACWALLERYFQPRAVPHLRLFKVLNSLPFPLGCTAINWGHNYGRLSLLDDEDFYPWEDWKRLMEEPEPENVLNRCNPYDIQTEIVALLALRPDHEAPPAQIHSPDTTVKTFAATKSNANCFDRLPVELCLAISSFLPTSDALHSRMASRAFWPIFYNQQFWATRFQPGSVDRSWLFEACGERGLDWRWLYRQTHDSRLSPALSYRKCVWRLIEHVARILALQGHGLESTSTPPSPPQSDLSHRPMFASITVSGDLTHLKPDQAFLNFHKGCRILYKRRVHIPRDLKSVAIFTVDVGGTYYIAGLTFTSATGGSIQVGYCSKDYATDSVEVSRLCGFHIALGGKGFYGLRCNVGGDQQSRWLGHTSGSLRTERLAHSGCPLEELELGFDGCKLTSMTTCLPVPSKEALPKHDVLRTKALWYPEVPCSSMVLNEGSFIPQAVDRYLSGFQPLFFTHFGGPGGKQLRNLTGIKFGGVPTVCSIRFSYDNDVNVPPLGRTRLPDPAHVAHFIIDGPGGEAIVAIDAVYQTRFYASMGPWTRLVSFKMITNRGRSWSPAQGPTKSDHLTTVETIHMSASPGTMITALYGTQDPEFGLSLNALGIITEKCEPAGLG